MNMTKCLFGIILFVVLPTLGSAQQAERSAADQAHGHVLWKFETGG
jgi:hypothetical protein